MGYLRGYTTFTNDSEWPLKLFFTSLCILIASIVPIVTQAMVMGWTAMAMRHAVLSNALEPLPKFELNADYIVELMLSGLKQVAIQFIWMLPAIMLMMLIMLPMMFVMSASTMDDSPTPAALPCISLVLFPLIFLTMLPMQVALLRVELCDHLAAGFAFKEIFNFTRMMFLELLIGFVLVGIVGFFLSILGFVALCVGIFPASVLISYAFAQCRAYVYECYLAKGGEPWVVARPIDGAFPSNPGYRDPAVFA